MLYTTKKNRQVEEEEAPRLPRPPRQREERWRSGWVTAVVLCFGCLYLLCVLLQPNNSLWMVKGDALRALVYVCMAVIVLAFILYAAKRVLSGQDCLKLAAGAAIVGGGALFMASMYDSTAFGLTVYAFAVCLCAGLWLHRKKQLTLENLTFLIVVLGCAMRIAFVMNQPAYAHQHDTSFGYGFDTAVGHGEYIGILVETKWLPDSNSWQLYHPPLFHTLAALFYGWNKLLGADYFQYTENLQFMTALFSCLFLLVWHKILRRLRFGRVAFVTAISLLSFHPVFYFLGATVNNDMLMWLLASVALLYLIKWMQEASFKNILLMAVSLGFAMMAKVTAVILAPVMGIVFLVALVGAFKGEGRPGRLIGQYAAFGAVSIPLGMWHPVRNLLQFGQVFGYVPLPGGTDSGQYIGNVPLLQRLVPLDLSTIGTPYVVWNNADSNLWIKGAKTALFGEGFRPSWEFAQEWLALVLGFVNYALMVLSLVAIIHVLATRRHSRNARFYWVLAGVWLVQVASYIFFAIQYPWQCTLDARYIVLAIGIGAVFIGRMAGGLIARAREKGSIPGRVLGVAVCSLAGVFCLLATVIYASDSLVYWF